MIDSDSGEQAKSAAMVNAERERRRLVKNARQRTMYGPTHRRRRAEFARHIERGDFPICPRCGRGIGPDELWDLGHDDYDPRLERPEHRAWPWPWATSLRGSWRASSSRRASSSCSESVVGLRHDLRSTHDAAFTLAALKDWTFLFGPGFFPLGNGLLLGYLMYRSGLVPRRMAWVGMIGGPLLFIAGVGVLFDWWDAGGTVPSLATIPEFIWELFLGVYCTIWGFRKESPILRPNWRGNAAV